jgi:predicted RND superfamily exporter protein
VRLGTANRADRRANEKKSSTPRQYRLALGLERLGLMPLRFPTVIAVAAAILLVAAGRGLERIKIDDSLSQLFRANTPEFRQYEAVTRQFPSSEYDVLVVVEGKTLLERTSIEKLREFVTDLQLVSGTRGIISLFSARQPPKDGRIPAPLFPDRLPQGAAYKELIKRVTANEIIRGKLLSLDGQLALIVLALDPTVAHSGLAHVIGEVRKTVRQDLANSDLRAELSGVPVMQLEIRNAVERARVVYNAAGFAAGCLIAIAFFRRVSFMFVATLPPLCAVIFVLGALGWLGIRLNLLLDMMAPLIMVISFSDSMQLTFALRGYLMAGDRLREACRQAICVVGPACVITHATAGLSFMSLLFSSSTLIRQFGVAGIIASIIALVTVLMLVPLLGLVLLRGRLSISAADAGADFGVDALRRFCAWIAARMVRNAGYYSLAGLAVVGVLAISYAQLQPRWQLSEEVPAGDRSVTAAHLIDQRLIGANLIDVLIRLPAGASLYAPATLATIGDVQQVLERQPRIGNAWSLETLRRWLAKSTGSSDGRVLKQYVQLLPSFLVRRFISADEREVLVSGRVPDADASRLLSTVTNVNSALDTVRLTHPGYGVSITGLSVIAARNSANMIERLNRGLTLEIVFVAAFIGLVFRSPAIAIAVIAPAIFPVVLTGNVLRVIGEGLQFASVVALTVSFGLSLSATIHFLNRMRLESRSGDDPAIAVERATVLVGPALILTSVVLACSLAATTFSNLPFLQLFGWLSAFSMLMALVADLLILRPMMTFLLRAVARLRRGRFDASGSTN